MSPFGREGLRPKLRRDPSTAHHRTTQRQLESGVCTFIDKETIMEKGKRLFASLALLLLTFLTTGIVPAGADTGMKNVLINGNMDIAQRGTSINPVSDATYVLDRFAFIGISSGAVTQASSVAPSGSRNYMTVNSKSSNNQNGIVQIVESVNSAGLIGQNSVLSFQARTVSNVNNQISNLRAAGLCWVGTADTVTRDVVGTWKSDGVNPIWATNWSLSSTPVNLALTNSWQKFTISDIKFNSDCANIAVVIWVDDGTLGASDEWDITQVQLEAGAVATDFEQRSIGAELLLAQRYYEKGMGQSDIPGITPVVGWESTASGATTQWWVGFAVLKRGTTSVRIWSSVNPFPSGISKLWNATATVDVAGYALVQKQNGFVMYVDGAGISGNQYSASWDADSEL
jgi:hypothetical protein